MSQTFKRMKKAVSEPIFLTETIIFSASFFLTSSCREASANISNSSKSEGLFVDVYKRQHQGFVYPEKEKRQAEVEKTIHQIELAYMLGIPTMRLNTGRWGTIESFDELMANKGIEPVLEGYTEEDGFKWVIDAIEQLSLIHI